MPLLYSKTVPWRWCETSPVPVDTVLAFRYPYAGEGQQRITRLLVLSTVFANSFQARPSHLNVFYDAAVFTLCYRLLTCSPRLRGFTYRFNTRIASCIGYMLPGFLVLPGQDFHPQAPTSLAGHETNKHSLGLKFSNWFFNIYKHKNYSYWEEYPVKWLNEAHFFIIYIINIHFLHNNGEWV